MTDNPDASVKELKDLRRFIDTFKLLDDDINLAISQTSNILKIDIANIKNYNPKYTVIAYNILVSLQKQPLQDEDKLFVTNFPPKTPQDYTYYNNRSVLEYLMIMFPEDDFSKIELIAKHLEMVLTYMKSIETYINRPADLSFTEEEGVEFDEDELAEFGEED